MKKISIRHITLGEMNEIKNKQKMYVGKHNCDFLEKVFLFNPGGGLLNPRAYKVCHVCGKINQIEITKEIGKAIEEILRIKSKNFI